jgi:YidC/Oxa1 family membrane protein insertase
MDKNTTIGLLLIGAIIVVFSIYNRPNQEELAKQRRIRDSLAMVEIEKARAEAEAEAEAEKQVDDSVALIQQARNDVADFFNFALSEVEAESDSLATLMPAERKLVPLENEKVKLLLDTKGGGIHSVQLKGYLRYNKDSLYLFEGDEGHFNLDLYNRKSVKLSSAEQMFVPIISDDGRSVTMRLKHSDSQYLDFVYTLPENEYMMKFDIRLVGMSNGLHPESLTNFKINWAQKLRRQEKGEAFEKRYSRIFYRYHNQGTKKMSESRKDTKEITEPIQWFAFKDQFFTSVVIPDKPFETVVLSSTPLVSEDYLKDYKADTWAPIVADPEKNEHTVGFRYYFGPVHYTTLKAYNKGVENPEDKLYLHEQVELGYRWLSWVNKGLVIPVFNFFLSLNWNMGLIIFILTLMVKLIILPLTYKSYMSSAKMRVLRPQIVEIEKKYPGQDQDSMLKRQQATMELYQKAGVNPMSGCLPMLLQMPVLLALFFFFPSAIELRQQGFLWADDLSTYDSIISWSANIPFISRFLGDHISLFCLLMTTTNIIFALYNMSLTDTGQQQMKVMKYMPVFMSLFMFFILNSYPAGLNYYYFLSTLISIIITFMFKQFVDDDKLLAQLEENRKKPTKKSGFMARLEEAQKMQEKQARERAKENAKRNYRRR